MAHLIVIPAPGAGHLVSAVEMAKLLVERDDRLSVTVLIMSYTGVSDAIFVATNSSERMSFVDLSGGGFVPDPSKLPGHSFADFVDYHKPQVRDLVEAAIKSESTRLAGVVVDMFCTTMIDVADEFGVPSYVFFTSGAGFLSLLFYGMSHDITEFKDSDTELVVPGYINSVPSKVLPITLMDGDWSELFHTLIRRFKKSRGILVNTFFELESHAIGALSTNDEVPPIFPVGPILNLTSDESRNLHSTSIFDWLDKQPRSSVLFLCFGSRGCFDVDQVADIAIALERSGVRFLWSCRKPPPKGTAEFPKDYEDVASILPDGFLERTKEIGKVIGGWAPQVAVLSHPAIGGFVSHCGWNSTLESLWYGVPIATWPFYAEQQLNAFQLVKELGLGVEIKLDYKISFVGEAKKVTVEEIEGGIKKLMNADNDHSTSIKLEVKAMSNKSRAAVGKNGSSYVSLDSFIENVIGNIS